MSSNSIKNWAINIFIVSYIFILALWTGVPMPRAYVINNFVRPFIVWSGLWQSYEVFAPPRDVNLALEARIKFQDGSEKIWSFPKVEQMDLFNSILHERWRKYGFDHLNWEKEKYLWIDFAKYLAHKFANTANQPVSITLIRHWVKTPTPEEGLGKPAPAKSNTYEFFQYDVQAGDLS